MRGTDVMPDVPARIKRFIPADAGNGPRDNPHRQTKSVYPRGCGERSERALVWRSADGLSPRMRGTALQQRIQESVFRFIPADAGNGFTPVIFATKQPVYPRGCGERNAGAIPANAVIGLSPRMRG